MNRFQQILTVTIWEYHRFFKIKNELIGIAIMLVMGVVGFFGGSYLFLSGSDKQEPVMVHQNVGDALTEELSETFEVTIIDENQKQSKTEEIITEKEGVIIERSDEGYLITSWKEPKQLDAIQEILNSDALSNNLAGYDLTRSDFEQMTQPALLETQYLRQDSNNQRNIVGFIFSGFLIMAVFLSLAYQFTGITGEKQQKITEQIISAIKPQTWMDGKILGITLTGLSSVVTYSIIGILGGILFFQLTGAGISDILPFLHLPTIFLFLVFTLVGILMWNAFFAAIASIITDPNNSGKSSLMFLPMLLAFLSFLVPLDPDGAGSIFLSWFPLTSASAMPMRWATTDLPWYEVTGSWLVLSLTFYFFRILAARIFRISILISGKEPTWKEVFGMLFFK